MPLLGFIEAGATMEETMMRINRAEVKKEQEDNKMLKFLQKENPGKCITKFGDGWYISEAPLE